MPRHDDDAGSAKLAVVLEQPPPVVSFTFGIPDRSVIEAVKAAGSEVWITVTTAAEARRAVEAGADALAAQGAEAGGHRGGLTDDPVAATGTMALLPLVTAAVTVPVVAAGGIATGAGVAAALCLGARAAALGTAFLDCQEAGTAAVHRAALHGRHDTGRADEPDPRVQRPHRARHRQRLPARAFPATRPPPIPRSTS